MAYAEDLKSSGRKAVWVRLPPRVPKFRDRAQNFILILDSIHINEVAPKDRISAPFALQNRLQVRGPI